MWGSINSGSTDTCDTCPNFNACKSSVQTLAPVLCEDLDPGAAPKRKRPFRHWIARNYADHLTPGETVTAAALAARVGSSPHAAATWLAHMAQLSGAICHAGRLKSDPKHYVKLYAYNP
jgi:hypothetical protein